MLLNPWKALKKKYKFKGINKTTYLWRLQQSRYRFNRCNVLDCTSASMTFPVRNKVKDRKASKESSNFKFNEKISECNSLICITSTIATISLPHQSLQCPYWTSTPMTFPVRNKVKDRKASKESSSFKFNKKISVCTSLICIPWRSQQSRYRFNRSNVLDWTSAPMTFPVRNRVKDRKASKREHKML